MTSVATVGPFTDPGGEDPPLPPANAVWLLDPDGPGHKLAVPIPGRVKRADCGIELTWAQPTTMAACVVFKVKLCRACFPFGVETATSEAAGAAEVTS